jgi:hypothetical protein
MDLNSFAQWAHGTSLAEWMRSSLLAMPIVEAAHVLAVAMVFGSILVVDLRLLGYPNSQRPFTRVSDEMLWITWLGFALAVVTGAMMFAPNAPTYVINSAFQFKMLSLLAAGINMAVFQWITARGVARWDSGAATPPAAKLAGALSILIWVTVILLARWIGFTKGYNFDIPEDVQFDFS